MLVKDSADEDRADEIRADGQRLGLAAAAVGRRRQQLRADCERCAGLCCVAPAFSVSADFAIGKAAGQPCPNLRTDFRCSIHERLRPAGFRGCAAFDCLEAGQKVTRNTFAGADWRSDRELAGRMFAAFAVMRGLHELLWYLNEARALEPGDPSPTEIDAAISQTERLALADEAELVGTDVDAHRGMMNGLLLRASSDVRQRGGPLGPDFRGADLAGQDLRGADLTGADLRGADLSGADLAASLFLMQSQIDVAGGDDQTRLPAPLSRPPHWAAAG
jgi:uncharacterized protein YjbI with pentapeptide repeats